MKMNKCVNTLPSHVDSVFKSSKNNDKVSVLSDDPTMDYMCEASATDHMSCAAEPRYDLCANTTVNRDV